MGFTFASNTMSFYLMIISVVTFDVIPDEVQEIMLNFLFYLPSDIPYNEKFVMMSYQTGYILQNLLSLFMFLFFGFVQLSI